MTLKSRIYIDGDVLSEQNKSAFPFLDAEAMQQMMTPLQQLWQRAAETGDTSAAGDATHTADAATPVIDPVVLKSIKDTYLERSAQLWQNVANAVPPEIHDRRFADPEWKASPLYAFYAASHELNEQVMTQLIDAIEMPPRQRQKMRFGLTQWLDAMAPSNYLATNPSAQKKLIDTKGESLARGMNMLLSDVRVGHISHTDETAFEVGVNLATTAGSVVFEHPLFQLIQYQPVASQVYQTPLLIVPPCINKYYILDLQPHNSLVRYAVEAGHTVFLISWRNADDSVADATWAQYIDDGCLRAIRAVQDITQQEQINALGFCVGGTLLATAAATLEARGESALSSLTLLTALLDFSDTGQLDVFIDEMQVAWRERTIGQGGLMLGADFASAFSSLRPNDLIWNYVESRYLSGQEPKAFDLLYWNADSTNLPGPMFCYYLRKMYLENLLRHPGALDINGTPIDLGAISAPAFIYASREDHIVPWHSAYDSARLINVDDPSLTRFVLGASGHIAGVINPAGSGKRQFWTSDNVVSLVDQSAEEWLAKSAPRTGSWWLTWAEFLQEHAGPLVAARVKGGSADYPVLEAAPGSYVKAR